MIIKKTWPLSLSDDCNYYDELLRPKYVTVLEKRHAVVLDGILEFCWWAACKTKWNDIDKIVNYPHLKTLFSGRSLHIVTFTGIVLHFVQIIISRESFECQYLHYEWMISKYLGSSKRKTLVFHDHTYERYLCREQYL